MDGVYEELDEAKDAIEKLKENYRIKAELSASLKKTHNEQLAKTQEAKLEIEKQAQELSEKAEEISLARQMYEEVKSSLLAKESALRCLSSASDKFRADCGEKLQKLEGENRELVSTLDEVNMRSKDLEQKNCVYRKEIEGLKGLLSVAQMKCSEAEKRAQASKELRERDDLLLNLEEENRKIEDQLKWKKEQFKHLEEAHKKLQDQFRASKKEWELEKTTLVDEIGSLQTSLDSQTRISEGLQSRLQMCNQALAHEESRRKLLEFQISKSKTCYENVLTEYQEAKSKIESLTCQRDEEIASLRNMLGTKEMLFKDMEFRMEYLEKENQELRISLKEFQEAQIKESGSTSSLTKLRNKLRGLEQVHRDCSSNLKAREAEWNSQMEKMTGDLNTCRYGLNCKDKQIQELQRELEDCHSSIMNLKLLTEEISVMLMVLKLGFSEAQSKFSNSKAEMEQCNKEMEERIAYLMEQLEKKNVDLVKVYAEIEQEREKAASLMKSAESSDLFKQQYFLMQTELGRYKEMLEESSACQLRLKEQASQLENSLKEELRKVSNALERTNSELVEKINEGSEVEYELQSWKSVAERLKACLDENQEVRRQMEASLLAQIETEQTLKQENETLLHTAEEKERRIEDLLQQIVLLEQELTTRKIETTRIETEKVFEQEKDKSIDNLHLQISCLEQELEASILVQMETEKTFEQEKESLLRVAEEKNQRVEDLLQRIMTLEQDFTRSVNMSVLSGLKEKQAEIELLREAWEKISTIQVLAELEIQEKNLLVVELEEDINSLQQKLELQEESLSHSKQKATWLEAELEAKHREMVQVENKMRTSHEALLKDIKKLLSERKDLLDYIAELSFQISEFSHEDTELMGSLERMVQNFEKQNVPMIDLKGDEELYGPDRENVKTPFSPSAGKIESSPDRRSPFKVLNH